MNKKTKDQRTREAWLVLAVFVFAFLLYANTIGHDFVWDDRVLIVEGVGDKPFDTDQVRKIFTSHFWADSEDYGSLYRPVVSLSYFVDRGVFGLASVGFHFSNVLVNALACAFVFLFVRLVFGNPLLALLTAVLFASHPLHTESVAWVSGRTDVYCAFWLLGSLVLYALSRRGLAYLWIPLSIVAFVLALMSKEIAVILPFLIAYLEFGMRPANERKTPARSMVIVVLYTAVLLAYLLFRWRVVGWGVLSYEPWATGVTDRIALALTIFGSYVIKALAPFWPNAEYDAPLPSGLADGAVLLGLVILAAVGYLTYRFRKHPEVVLGSAIFVGALVPVLNLVPITEISAERFLYVPLLGFALVLGTVFFRAMASPGRQAAIIVFVLLATAYSARTVTRNRDWRSESVLFAKTTVQTPDNARAHLNMGNVYYRRGDFELAKTEYDKALKIDPNFSEVWSGLAGVYKQMGEIAVALEHIDRAISLEPEDPEYYNSRGSLLARLERYDEAVEAFGTSLQLRPDDPSTEFNLGLASFLGGNYDLAEGVFKTLLEKDESFVHAYYYLGVIAAENGDALEMRQQLRKFLSLYDQEDNFTRNAEQMINQ